MALASCNSTLEELHFGVIGIGDINVSDLVMLVENCRPLRCLKVGEDEMPDLVDVLNGVPHVEDFGAGLYKYLVDKDAVLAEDVVPVSFSKHIKSLPGMWSITAARLSTTLAIAPNLRKLDLTYTPLSSEGQCSLLRHCHSLKELQTQNTLGDEGMEILGKTRKELRKLRVEDDET